MPRKAAPVELLYRADDSWFYAVSSDKTEPEHRVDLLAGRLFCTCEGFQRWKHCKHSDDVRENELTAEETALVVTTATAIQQYESPQDMGSRLDTMRQERALISQFFKEVMVPSTIKNGKSLADNDYGIIPGAGDKPVLFKAGAEKLLEFFGYAPIIKKLDETIDHDTGYYRVVVTVQIIHRRTGAIIGEGVGECNTRESKYAYRWVSENKLPPHLKNPEVLRTMRKEEREYNRSKYWVYRVMNEEPHDVWNTVLKMGKKRALVDATLACTRSTFLFTMSAEKMDEWIDAEYALIDDDDEPDGVLDRDNGDQRPAATPASAAQPSAPAAAPARVEEPPEVAGEAIPTGAAAPRTIAEWRPYAKQLIIAAGLQWPDIEEMSQQKFGNRIPSQLSPTELRDLAAEVGVTVPLPGQPAFAV